MPARTELNLRRHRGHILWHNFYDPEINTCSANATDLRSIRTPLLWGAASGNL